MPDAFDALLISTATIMRKSETTADSYGVGDPTFITVATGVPCRVSANGGKQYNKEKKSSIQQRTVFLRPWTDPDLNIPLSHEHWFTIDGELYDIQYVKNPSRLNHHFEAVCNMVED